MAYNLLFFSIDSKKAKFNEKEAYELLDSYLPFLSDNVDNDVIESIILSLPSKVHLFEAKLEDEGEIDYIGRVLEIKVKESAVLVKLQNNLKAIIYPSGSIKRYDIVKTLQDSDLLYMHLVIRRGRKINGTNIVVKEFFPLIKKEADLSYILAYKNDNNKTNWELFLEAIGLQPKKELLAIYLPRFISIFKVPIGANMNYYNHVLQLTLPATGKTTFYVNLKFVSNVEIFTTFPSRARLVMDARAGRFGSVFLRDIIVIDAFDKNLDRQKFEDFFQHVETGLSNAIWSIEKSSSKESHEQKRHVGFVFLGNLEGKLDLGRLVGENIKNMRKYLQNIMEMRGIPKSSINAFVDRLAIVDINDTSIDVYKYSTGYMMKGPFLATFLRYLQRCANEASIDTSKITLDKRYSIYAIRIAKILKALDIEPAEELAVKLVSGEWNWQEIIQSSESNVKKEEVTMNEAKEENLYSIDEFEF
ncbi:MAG: BREX system Lon protease-like protein BrxL [Candidatus Aenigmatarchaeota archaeon]